MESRKSSDNRKLFVGGLAWVITSDMLKKLFEEGDGSVEGLGSGSVQKADVVTERDSGRSRGFGFVEVQTDQQVADAISKFNGLNYEGRTLTVNKAETKERGGSSSRGGFNKRGGGRFSDY